MATKKFVSYLHPIHGCFAQYHGKKAGFYHKNISKKDRREAEILAHKAGVTSMGPILHRFLLKKSKKGEIKLYGDEGVFDAMCTTAYSL